MCIKYYLHRISYEGNIAYDLLEKGYLSLGWSRFSKTEIMNEARKPGYPQFNDICAKEGEGNNRSRWAMWYFAQMKGGDIVVVPQYGGLFSVYEICGQAESICEYDNRIGDIVGKWQKTNIIWKDGFLHDADNGRQIDIGFLIPVREIIKDAKRDFVSASLVSRMKIRSTNADITDIAADVDKGIEAWKNQAPISLYEVAIGDLVEKMRESIITTLTPDKFEKLIKWYLKKCGASNVWIPVKNESGKYDGADADVVAEFDSLKYIVYVQAKHHRGETGDWAVQQITKYKEQKRTNEEDSDYTYATWVVSSADCFSKNAEEDAAQNGVRLIDGKEFARMLIDIGLLDINSAFQND